jgi:hypothetical protein
MHSPDAENFQRPDQNGLFTKQDVSVQVISAVPTPAFATPSLPKLPTPEPHDLESQSPKPAPWPSANSDGTTTRSASPLVDEASPVSPDHTSPATRTPPPRGSGSRA